ncbi:MAG: hypothetical protein EXR36_11975 [Betaproteobacteria bacterium]|nr:hypothetical protein [Betaproteobacteria bacterium]
MRLRYAATFLAFTLAGCGTSGLHLPSTSAPAAQGVQSGAQAALSERPGDENKYLKQLYSDTRLDPIRDKVPLQVRADAVTAGYLRNENKPTPEEKQAIRVWLQVREKAQKYQATRRGQPSGALLQTRVRVSQAISQLYSGKLTYAGFAKRVQEIDAQYQASRRQNIGQSEHSAGRP